MIHSRRLVTTIAGLGLASASAWMYSDEDMAPVVVVKESATKKSKRSRSNSLTGPWDAKRHGIEQSYFRKVGDYLASATVQASTAYVSLAGRGNQALNVADRAHPQLDAKQLIASSNFDLLLNLVASDTNNTVHDDTYKAINRAAERNVECAAAIAERATRYGKQALLHLARRNDLDGRLGDALRGLTVLNGNECRFGPANLTSLVALVCASDLPPSYAEFAWWALAASASDRALTSRYRWRKTWFGDDRVARTRSVLMRNPYIWSALLATDAASPEVQLQASSLVKELVKASSMATCLDDDKLDLIWEWFVTEDDVPLSLNAIETLAVVAADPAWRANVLGRGFLDQLHHKMHGTKDPRLAAAVLRAVHAVAFSHASSDLDAHALSRVDDGVSVLDDDWLGGSEAVDEPTYNDISREAVRCLEALSTSGSYKSQGVQEWLIAVLDQVLRNVPYELATQASTVRAARSRTRPLQNAPPNKPNEFLDAHTRALRALAFVIERPACQAAFVKAGGLPLLNAMAASLDKDGPSAAKFQIEWARVIANLASSAEMDWHVKSELQRGAWTSALEALATSSNVQVKMQARRALHNLSTAYDATMVRDKDEDEDEDAMERRLPEKKVVYLEGVHPMLGAPTEGTPATYDVDVVFIHGLLGCAYETWIGGDNIHAPDASTPVWANDWLVADLQARGLEPRVVSLGYDSKIFASESNFETLCLEDTSRDLLQKLQKAQVGTSKRPVVFVTHSMGGIVLKKMLSDAADHNMQSLPEATSGLMFYSTPHHGSPVAVALQRINVKSLNLAHPVVADLHGTPRLKHLNEWCASFASTKGDDLHVLSVGETRPMKIPIVGVEAVVVPEASSNPGFGEYVRLDDADHIDVCKPKSMEDVRYTLARDFILRAVPPRRYDNQLEMDDDDDDDEHA
ncbi:hypothetical protein SPRG_10211 [Saprolegnia parasitica CBS 223.65]|uniref:Protein SERAC1 n=1 Tax=Saprolegnia parasitica (strain CBS 223.65) TaxID=695850 RepID=A0A067C2G8_SAPPC|nr:hypothetical protein SPRG_10211 [Saprolegnia parasitica CBS 223.65]KDO24678.1 hypothetical protein SPRG_10211 [Saprolegnia parasitica CBS 223.65]|eukprot:XP_012204559.1 hypothetical protein SPRG_10211 [Saprolegnia parasitica CBS 223.65]